MRRIVAATAASLVLATAPACSPTPVPLPQVPGPRPVPGIQILVGKLRAGEPVGGTRSLRILFDTVELNLEATPAARTFVNHDVQVEGGTYFVERSPDQRTVQWMDALRVEESTAPLPSTIVADAILVGRLVEAGQRPLVETRRYVLLNVSVDLDTSQVTTVSQRLGQEVLAIGQFTPRHLAGTIAWMFRVSEIRDR